ncbi:putative RNA-binding protein with TRAM domain [Paraburkholderia fungorum]|nr:putative RNA-binding protein with TRAM domain [Paraburkholderia fungorum]
MENPVEIGDVEDVEFHEVADKRAGSTAVR